MNKRKVQSFRSVAKIVKRSKRKVYHVFFSPAQLEELQSLIECAREEGDNLTCVRLDVTRRRVEEMCNFICDATIIRFERPANEK